MNNPQTQEVSRPTLASAEFNIQAGVSLIRSSYPFMQEYLPDYTSGVFDKERHDRAIAHRRYKSYTSLASDMSKEEQQKVLFEDQVAAELIANIIETECQGNFDMQIQFANQITSGKEMFGAFALDSYTRKEVATQLIHRVKIKEFEAELAKNNVDLNRLFGAQQKTSEIVFKQFCQNDKRLTPESIAEATEYHMSMIQAQHILLQLAMEYKLDMVDLHQWKPLVRERVNRLVDDFTGARIAFQMQKQRSNSFAASREFDKRHLNFGSKYGEALETKDIETLGYEQTFFLWNQQKSRDEAMTQLEDKIQIIRHTLGIADNNPQKVLDALRLSKTDFDYDFTPGTDTEFIGQQLSTVPDDIAEASRIVRKIIFKLHPDRGGSIDNPHIRLFTALIDVIGRLKGATDPAQKNKYQKEYEQMLAVLKDKYPYEPKISLNEKEIEALKSNKASMQNPQATTPLYHSESQKLTHDFERFYQWSLARMLENKDSKKTIITADDTLRSLAEGGKKYELYERLWPNAKMVESAPQIDDPEDSIMFKGLDDFEKALFAMAGKIK